MDQKFLKLAIVSMLCAKAMDILLKQQKIPNRRLIIPALSAVAAKYLMEGDLKTLSLKKDQGTFWAVSYGAGYAALNCM